MSDTSEHSPVACVRAWHTLRAMHDQVSRELESALAACCSITSTELQAMVSIDASGVDGVRLTALCEQVNLSQPAVSRLVERLEARDLIDRQADESDRRGVLLRLTPEGRVLTQRASVVHAATVSAALGSMFASSEQERILAALQLQDDRNE